MNILSKKISRLANKHFPVYLWIQAILFLLKLQYLQDFWRKEKKKDQKIKNKN